MKVKVCGITNIQDAEAAVRCGADYIGLVFVKDTSRYIDPCKARAIVELIAGRAKIVGVFQDQTFSEIEAISKIVSLDMVQLHGSESLELCTAISLPVIKAISVNFDQTGASDDRIDPKYLIEPLLEKIEMYNSHCQHILIDRRKSTADSDWLPSLLPNIAKVEHRLGKYFLAGGLSEQRIVSVLSAVKPFSLDLSSSIEVSPGRKNHQLIMEFLGTVRRLTNREASGETKIC